MILPVIVLALTGVPRIVLPTREKVIDVMESPYVRFAQSRGSSMRFIISHHAMRNLILPALTLQLASVGEVLGGSILIEQVFSYPGLGQAAVTAALGGDAPLLVGIVLATTSLVFMGNLCANVLYVLIDPRIRSGRVRYGS